MFQKCEWVTAFSANPLHENNSWLLCSQIKQLRQATVKCEHTLNISWVSGAELKPELPFFHHPNCFHNSKSLSLLQIICIFLNNSHVCIMQLCNDQNNLPTKLGTFSQTLFWHKHSLRPSFDSAAHQYLCCWNIANTVLVKSCCLHTAKQLDSLCIAQLHILLYPCSNSSAVQLLYVIHLCYRNLCVCLFTSQYSCVGVCAHVWVCVCTCVSQDESNSKHWFTTSFLQPRHI